jgi:hypothetical protein
MQQSEKESPVLLLNSDLTAPICKRKRFDAYRSTILDWQSASNYCTDNSMNLATFKSYDEALFFPELSWSYCYLGWHK